MKPLQPAVRVTCSDAAAALSERDAEGTSNHTVAVLAKKVYGFASCRVHVGGSKNFSGGLQNGSPPVHGSPGTNESGGLAQNSLKPPQ